MQDGTAVCDFSVAVTRRWKSRDGAQQEKTTWFRVTCWRQLAEVAHQYVHKGMQIMASGEIEASAYIGQDGDARSSLDLTARDVLFLGGKDDDAGGGKPRGKPGKPGDEMPF